jgi:hypothetical protein
MGGDLLTPEEVELLNGILRSSDPSAGLPPNLHNLLLLKGAVQTLAEDGSPEATQYYLQAPKPVQQRILDAAKRSGMQNWALLITSVDSTRAEPLRHLVQQFSLFNERERWLTLELLKTRASTGSEKA